MAGRLGGRNRRWPRPVKGPMKRISDGWSRRQTIERRLPEREINDKSRWDVLERPTTRAALVGYGDLVNDGFAGRLRATGEHFHSLLAK